MARERFDILESLLKFSEPFHPAERMEQQSDSFSINVRWLMKGGCDCTEALVAMEKNVRQYSDPYPKKFFVNELLRLQGKPEE